MPGCGKSALADALASALRADGCDVRLLRMDERRKSYIPKPRYTHEERDVAYAMFAEEAAQLAGQGLGVILDATAHRLRWRRLVRERGVRFAEIFLRCRLETAMQREATRPDGLVMAGLYAKALQRKRGGSAPEGLGEVVGVDVPFEADPDAECIIDNDELSLEQSVQCVLAFVRAWLDSRAGKTSCEEK